MDKSLRDFGYMVSDGTQTLMNNEPSQFELHANHTSCHTDFRHLNNEEDNSDKCVSIYMHYINVWHRRVRRVLDFGLEDLIVRELKRSRSERPFNRCPKMTHKHIYRDKFLQKLNNMHASVNNNLTKKVREDVNEYVADM